MKQLLSKRWASLSWILLIMACAPLQTATRMAPAETQAAHPAITPTAVVIPTAAVIPTATINPCTDLGWAEIRRQIHLEIGKE